jgi:hypothetical protein
MPDAVGTHLRRAQPGLFLAGNRALLNKVNTIRALKQKMSARLLDTLWEEAEKKPLAKTQRRFQRNLWLRRFGFAAPHKPKIIGCHFSLFRADAARINGFDEQFVGWGLEDDDFARRLYRAGMRGSSVILKARALHLWHPSVESYPRTIAASPNMAYFKRAAGAAYCVNGLNKAAAAG